MAISTRDPAYAVQKAVYAALMASADVATAFGTSPVQVFDRVPMSPNFPFIHISGDHILPLNEQFSGASQAFVVVDVFSRAVGSLEMKLIAGAVRSALDQNLAVTGFNALTYEYQDTKYMLQQDGITSHAVLTVRYTLSVALP